MNTHLFERSNGHRGGVIWFTGLPGSGKTTLANALQKMLLELGIRCVVMDGDRLRKGLIESGSWFYRTGLYGKFAPRGCNSCCVSRSKLSGAGSAYFSSGIMQGDGPVTFSTG